jgi:Zn ribbon nucleic-acid-binding protein
MNFWANKLNGNPVQQTVIPSRDLFNITGGTAQTPEINTSEYVPSVRLKEGGRCPGCSSDRYMSMGSYAIACSECGYHPRFEQTGYGERSLKTKPGEATPARQAEGDFFSLRGAVAQLNNEIHQGISHI